MKKARYHFNIVLRPEPEGGFTALVPALPGCVTYGRTLAEAKAMAGTLHPVMLPASGSTASQFRPTTKRW